MLLIGLFVLVVCGCGEAPTGSPEYTEIQLTYNAFMHHSVDTIATRLGRILNLEPVFFNRIAPKGAFPGQAEIGWVQEGYEFIAANGGTICVWVDSDDEPYLLTYVLHRFGKAHDWIIEQEKADSVVLEAVTQMGINFDGTETFESDKYACGPQSHWYHIHINQTYNDEPLRFAYILADVEGDTAEIFFLVAYRWHTNISDIATVRSDEELKIIALWYFLLNEDVVSIDNSLGVIGSAIVENKLCRQIGRARYDEYGSYMDLFINVQNGEIVAEERTRVR